MTNGCSWLKILPLDGNCTNVEEICPGIVENLSESKSHIDKYEKS